MRKWILHVHLYGGLLCSSYLLIFGFSSLSFNHHFAAAESVDLRTEWSRAVTLPVFTNKDEAAETVRDRLGLMGWPLPWKTSLQTNGDLVFDLSRPGKDYTIHALKAENRVVVEERRKGFWNVVNSLHAMGPIPNATFPTFWGYYLELSTFVVLFAGVSGVYLWGVRQRDKVVGTIILIGAFATSLAVMFRAWKG